MFLTHCPPVRLARMSGFRFASPSRDGIAFVFEDKTVRVPVSQVDVDKFRSDRQYREGLIALFCGLMIR